MSKSYSNFRTLFGRNNVFPSPKESFQPFLRKDVFPIQCNNVSCGREYNDEDFLWAIGKRGLVYADSRETIFQGFNCPYCNKTTLIKMPASNPVVDLRKFILVPNASNLDGELHQQLYEFIRHHLQDSPLKYNFIPVWDTEQASFQDIVNYFYDPELFPDTYIPEDWLQDYNYFMSKNDVIDKQNIENSKGHIMLKRLLPDSEFSRHLCALLNPFTEVHVGISPEEWMNKLVDENSHQDKMILNATHYFFKKPTINEVLYSVFSRLKASGCSISQTKEHENIASQQIQHAGFILSKEMMNQAKKTNFMDLIDTIISPIYKTFINKACNIVALSSSRSVLSSWLEKVKKNTVLFVDAPMGLGKTCSIVRTLSDDLTLSAVIFLPTKKLCREIEFSLKNAIAWKLGIYPRVHFEGTEYYRRYYKEDINSEEYSIEISRFKTRFLKNHVYYLDGINEQECPFYEEIISQYQNRWYQKREFCLKCPYNTSCRFFHHFEICQKIKNCYHDSSAVSQFFQQ